MTNFERLELRNTQVGVLTINEHLKTNNIQTYNTHSKYEDHR